MKYRITIIASVLFISLFSTSCNENLLDVEPVNEYLSSNFFSSEQQVFEGLVAAYDPFGWSMAYGQWISYVMFGEIRSDNANAGGDPSNNDQPGWQEFDDYTNNNTNAISHAIYRKNYIGIFRANTVIQIDNFSTDLVNRYQAEAKVLRAYYHFDLFRHFGPIPVVTELLAPDDVALERNTLSEVFTQITTDLEEAIPVLPTTLSSSEQGRMTKGAAQALLGKAYLYWADMLDDDVAKFDLAADAFRDVVESGVYELAPDYQSLFGFDIKNPSESILEVQHNNLYPSDWGWFEGIDGNGMIQLCGIRGLCDAHPDLKAGWGFLLPTKSLNDHYLSDDTYRQDVALTTIDELTDEIESVGGDCSTIVDVTQINPIDYTGFWSEKYSNYKAYDGNNVNGGDPNLTKNGNTYVIRYADVLLMLGEAIERGSGSQGEALGFVNQVRERAAGPGSTGYKTAEEIMSENSWSALELIWYERRAELALEGDRWYDLVRSGRANGDLFESGDPRATNINANSLWLPIALEEMSVTTGLTEYPDASLFK